MIQRKILASAIFFILLGDVSGSHAELRDSGYNSHIEREVMTATDRFFPEFDAKIYSHYTGNEAIDEQIKDSAVRDCYGKRPTLIQQIDPSVLPYHETQPMSGYYLMTRYGEIERQEGGQHWKAPYCLHDVELLGPIHFVKTGLDFSGPRASEDCEARRVLEMKTGKFIRAICDEQDRNSSMVRLNLLGILKN